MSPLLWGRMWGASQRNPGPPPTGSYCPHVGKLGINWKDIALLLIGGMVVKARVVIYRNRIGQFAFCEKFAMYCNDNSCSVANPFVRLQRKSQVVESADGEGRQYCGFPLSSHVVPSHATDHNIAMCAFSPS